MGRRALVVDVGKGVSPPVQANRPVVNRTVQNKARHKGLKYCVSDVAKAFIRYPVTHVRIYRGNMSSFCVATGPPAIIASNQDWYG